MNSQATYKRIDHKHMKSSLFSPLAATIAGLPTDSFSTGPNGIVNIGSCGLN